MGFVTFLVLSFLLAANGQFSLNPAEDDKECLLADGEIGECVVYYLCHNETNKIITDGAQILDIRALGECDYTEMCCGLPDKDESIGGTATTVRPGSGSSTGGQRPGGSGPGTGGQGPGTGGSRPGTGGTGPGTGGTGPGTGGSRPGTGGTGPGTGGTGPGTGGSRPGTGGTGPGTGGGRPGTGIGPPIAPGRPPVTACGVRNPNGVAIRIVGDKNNEAQFAEFPWMVAILKEEPITFGQNLYIYQCGGSLIHPKVVMTAAHCVKNIKEKLKVRAGEYDTQITSEPLPHQDKDVDQIVVHEHFYAGGMFNDIALLILDTPMDLKENIGVVCLPDYATTVNPATCYVSGWGKNQFGKNGSYQAIMKRIDLPVVLNPKCQTELRKTRLGKYFELNKSFMCAGGVIGKDACTGDGGAPLVCPLPSKPGRYMQAGIVSWGIGCGTTTPGVYANVPYLREWIDEQLLLNNIDISPYTN